MAVVSSRRGFEPHRPRTDEEVLEDASGHVKVLMAKMEPGDKLVVERFVDEPGKARYTVTMRHF